MSSALPAGVEARDVETAAGRIAVWNRPGEGAPLVLVHGNSASKAAFADLMVEPALDGRRLVALDLPGCGESEDARDPQTFYTIPAMARIVAETVERLALPAPVVLGWSLGGHIAIEAIGQGMAMSGLVLTGTPPCGPGHDELPGSFRDTEVMAVAFMEEPPEAMLQSYVEALYGGRRAKPEAFLVDARRTDGRLRATFSANWLKGQDGFHQRSVVAGWDGPIAVLQGEEDPFLHVEVLQSLAWGRLWRDAVQLLPAGHAPFFEHPALFAAELACFLRDIEG
ncbi:alpha/beta fold hydrolase [Brevundimonas sp. SORGH_AS_0993]|uniref:alpha/beta fold hydrolase n=1 Tax=Brevundimonas sp. SORGH_AS_0993 TaxID=3041794 RepID=UPI00278B5126|nr:alpha/beta fold hydrolase [Brevundimonas sp. SORGH_AS_0993]MDQ1154488.1 pimeloyl-ACP methyl ester carboxylesterase [Brevundimonas sp. SORGH_AS_0993]